MRLALPLPLERRLPDLLVLALLAMHALFAGRWWVWNLVSVVPPWMFLLPLVWLAARAAIRRDLFAAIVILPLACLLAWPQADVSFGRTRVATPGAAQVSVFTWNTQHWEEDSARRQALYAHLRAQDADVYHLQEHLRRDHTAFNDRAELEREFPGYRVFMKDEYLTLTRLPVLRAYEDAPGEFLRADLDVAGREVRFLNVHIPIHVLPGAYTPRAVLEDLRRRFLWRTREFRRVEAAVIAAGPRIFVSGDFNTTTSMGSMHPLLTRLTDSQTASPTVFPRTWHRYVRWWRIDWSLAGPGLRVLRHTEVDPGDLSDHWGQRVVVELLP